jgi:putative transposase
VSLLIVPGAPAVQAIRALAGHYPRYRYRTVRIVLGRQGHVMSADRAYRLWRHVVARVRAVPVEKQIIGFFAVRPRMLTEAGV